jgi:hypothetical protein
LWLSFANTYAARENTGFGIGIMCVVILLTRVYLSINKMGVTSEFFVPLLFVSVFVSLLYFIVPYPTAAVKVMRNVYFILLKGQILKAILYNFSNVPVFLTKT